eukprot:s1728_g13.t1
MSPAFHPDRFSRGSSSTRAAWANALWEQQRRAEAAHEAMAELRRALSGRRQRHEQVLFRSAGLSQELKEATAGLPAMLPAAYKSMAHSKKSWSWATPTSDAKSHLAQSVVCTKCVSIVEAGATPEAGDGWKSLRLAQLRGSLVHWPIAPCAMQTGDRQVVMVPLALLVLNFVGASASTIVRRAEVASGGAIEMQPPGKLAPELDNGSSLVLNKVDTCQQRSDECQERSDSGDPAKRIAVYTYVTGAYEDIRDFNVPCVPSGVDAFFILDDVTRRAVYQGHCGLANIASS